jgi:hypothetical protein
MLGQTMPYVQAVRRISFGGDARRGRFLASPDRQFCISRMRAAAPVADRISFNANQLAATFAAVAEAFDISMMPKAGRRPEQECT